MRRREYLRAVGVTVAPATAGCSGLVGPDVAVQVDAPAESYVGAPMGLELSPVVDDVDVRVRLSATDVRSAEFVGEFAVADDGALAGPVDGAAPAASAIVTDDSDPADDAATADATGALRAPLASLFHREGREDDPAFVAFGRSDALEAVEVDATVLTDGHQTDSTTVRRRLTDPDVSGERVPDDDVVGKLFEPSGEGPHPGVLVLHGSAGRLPAGYADLLAAHGYTALALQYFDGPGLPETLDDVPLAYFDRAVEYLTGLDSVGGDGVGLVGISRGVEPALLTAASVDRPAAVVGYVGSGLVESGFDWGGTDVGAEAAWTRDGEPIVSADTLERLHARIERHPTPAEMLTEGVDRLRSAAPADRAGIAVEEIRGPVTLLSGQDDRLWNSPLRSEYPVDRLDRHDHDHQFAHVTYGGAGHTITYPYSAFVGSYRGADFGGAPVPNANAAADGFVRALDTLQRGLSR